ncbi:LuxR C-terminal-related transcriptional regulator [Archangium violaceum]|uniref:helix-turn-helix transcriptional regulator n=1 Tax=Archangium violaceum TaxID=83451 RepID=UPI002B2EA903|nr:LuxR C-terminal-related transcriptional regulator [Archangium gephyra]
MTSPDWESIFAIWDALAEFDPSEVDAALRQLFESLARLLGADNVFWFAAVRLMSGSAANQDPGHGWRIRTFALWRPDREKLERLKLLQKSFDGKSDVPLGLTSTTLASGAGRFRVHRLRDGWIDFKTFQSTPHYERFYRKQRIDDRLWVMLPLGPDTESGFVIDKVATPKRFSASDAELAGLVFRGISWFHRALVLSHGLLVARSPLTTMERRVTQLLLTGRSEKEIAAALGSSIGTTHNHVGQIFRKFGVRSRAELTAIWLGHRVGRPSVRPC